MNDILNSNTTRIYKDSGDYKKSCPNCGAAIEGDTCKFCGTLFVDFACVDTNKPFYMKVKRQDGTIVIMPVKLTSIETYTDEDCLLYADDNPIYNCCGNRTLSMQFDIL